MHVLMYLYSMVIILLDKIVDLSMLNVILNLPHSTIEHFRPMDKYRYKGRLKMAGMQSVLISLWGFDDTFCTYKWNILVLVLEFFGFETKSEIFHE